MVGNAENLKAVDDYFFVAQDANAGFFQGGEEVGCISEFVVVAGGEIHAERRGKLLERCGQAVGIGFGAVKNIAGKEDYVRIESTRLGDDAFGKGGLIYMAEMQIANEQRAASSPGLRQVAESNGYAADADMASVEQSVDTHGNCNIEEEPCDKGPMMGCGRVDPAQDHGPPCDPGQARSTEQEVQKAQPYRGYPVNGRNQQAGGIEAEHRGENKAASQHQEHSFEGQIRRLRRISAECDPRGIEEPMGKQKNELNEGNSQDRPGFQTRVSLL